MVRAMSWLVTGGAGYIGAHVVQAMRSAGQDVVVLDDLSSGDERRIDGVPLIVGSTLDGELVSRVVRDHAVTAVVHLAAKKAVEESVREPLRYYRENVEGLRALLEAVTAGGVESFVFSSSAAGDGSPAVERGGEGGEGRPGDPDGRAKPIRGGGGA